MPRPVFLNYIVSTLITYYLVGNSVSCVKCVIVLRYIKPRKSRRTLRYEGRKGRKKKRRKKIGEKRNLRNGPPARFILFLRLLLLVDMYAWFYGVKGEISITQWHL